MDILGNHVPSIEALRPGLIEVVESGNASKKWFGCTFGVILFRGKIPEPIYAADDKLTTQTSVSTHTDWPIPGLSDPHFELDSRAQHVVPPLMPTVSASPTPNTIDTNAVDNPCVRPHVHDANLPGAVQILQMVSL
ncbi:uncharacterized protein F5891DRAFT_1275861 [Suillus fuscotomentosus]|uniref:Uncharacterized protein n=1 Tax=Suillus fuscotomentosus TaxID=1912939 RepID=A0AAD4EDJ1_9AGAM|nr:uncharacterized protein F5891DRAFT_1275861 [Suillus fuscotomentosus]KAG1904285.1 hypothetical protein F5891DRAFT_1275861 [Suillus fuscotomentosus]